MSSDIPSYMLNRDAVLADDGISWRHKRPPSYTRQRAYYDETKTLKPEAGSLPDLVNNLVKNWEIEFTYKTEFEQFKTVDQGFKMSLNGAPPVDGPQILEYGTYNALINKNDLYDPKYNSREDSHKTFKRMIPSFVWEATDVYSGPPKVAFKWRHWGVMKEDYSGVNEKGEKVEVAAHGQLLQLFGMAVAHLTPDFKIELLELWYDPDDLFRDIKGISKGDNSMVGLAASGSASGKCPFAPGAAGASKTDKGE